jgi:hypothetical protein
MTKKFLFLVIVSTILNTNTALSQNADHEGGGHFTKRIDYNVRIKGANDDEHRYNLDGKSILDRILFGTVNSPVEFVFENMREILAFRMVKNRQSGSYRLEIMQITDLGKMRRSKNYISKKINKIDMPPGFMLTVSFEGRDMIEEHNENFLLVKAGDEVYKPYRPESKIFDITNEFAEKLCNKMASLIDNFKAKGIPPFISDGRSVTFRTVVEDEVWSLDIHVPRGNAGKMADICTQIIRDALDGHLDASKYLEALDGISQTAITERE